MLRFGTVTINAAYEPPRPPIEPRRRVQTIHDEIGTQPEYIEDWGRHARRRIRFVSSASQGFVTGPQATALLALYEAGEAFALETDLLKPLGGTADTYTARFDPDTTPTFTPATPGGSLYYFDLTLIAL